MISFVTTAMTLGGAAPITGFAKSAFMKTAGADIMGRIGQKLNTPKKAMGGVVENQGSKYKPGGHVEGPGTGTSDSVQIQVSDGEFVVNAKATEQFRPLLEYINSSIPAH